MKTQIDLHKFTEEELIILNHEIVERLRSLQQRRLNNKLAAFHLGERVSFLTPDGRNQEGHISRINKKTISVVMENGNCWNVPPAVLKKVSSNKKTVPRKATDRDDNVVTLRPSS